VTGEFSKGQKGNSWDHLEKKGESGGMSFDQRKFFFLLKNFVLVKRFFFWGVLH